MWRPYKLRTTYICHVLTKQYIFFIGIIRLTIQYLSFSVALYVSGLSNILVFGSAKINIAMFKLKL